ncbi:helix-turn-helix domain-containing protein [Spiractinospora alimapuensis]|uniref:helix-turn-helix domain-containing protein n=1 Tax=Spiractinospora alimapuensis TaxID=2820884 RepID=UPI001F36A09F|nr:helix-turn-helix transcriptional regulator [Spiractinospora alimapuensis]QVQ54039.1 helix-turn-helix domain-containing protein [Spiractinospora alimapuensis]
MAEKYSPSARRRRLSQLLLAMREERGLKIEHVNARLGWPGGKLSRMERNEWKLPSPRDMRDLAEAYELSDDTREAIVGLARDARARGWWVEYKDVLRGGLADFESGASMIRTYESLFIPGLLQTPDYAAAVLRGSRVLNDEEITRRVESRTRRQQVLEANEPPRLWALVDEAALRKHVGGRDVMSGQIKHLIAMAERPNIDLQVIRDEAGAHAAMEGAFVLLDFPDPAELPLVYIETATEDLYLEAPKTIQGYVSIFSHICSSAESPEASVRYLDSLT